MLVDVVQELCLLDLCAQIFAKLYFLLRLFVHFILDIFLVFANLGLVQILDHLVVVAAFFELVLEFATSLLKAITSVALVHGVLPDIESSLRKQVAL